MAADLVGHPSDCGPPFGKEPQNGPFDCLFSTKERRPGPFVWREEGNKGPFDWAGIAVVVPEGRAGRRRAGEGGDQLTQLTQLTRRSIELVGFIEQNCFPEGSKMAAR